MQAAISTISRIQEEEGVTDTSLLNFVASDGETTVATRYVSSDTAQPASLYFAEGQAYERGETRGDAARAATAAVRAGGGESGAVGARSAAITGEADYHLAYGGTGARVCLIASEPVTASASDWVEVPRNTALVVCKEKDGMLTVIQAPLTATGGHPRQAEVDRCLEAVTGAAGITAGGRKGMLRLSVTTARQLQRAESDDGVPDTPRMDAAGPVSRLTRGPSTLSLDGSEFGLDNANGSESGGEHLLTGHRGPVVTLATYGDMLFSGSTDTTVKIWCLQECKYLTTLTGHRDPIRCLDVAAGVLVTAGAKTVRMWNLVDFSCIGVLRASDIRGSMKALVVAPEGTYVGGQDCLGKYFFD